MMSRPRRLSGPRMLFAALLAASVPAASAAGEIDSEHLFGLTEGTDIGEAGERELELEFAGRGGRTGGAYRVLSHVAALKLTLTDSFRIAPFVELEHHRIRSVPGLNDRNGGGFGALGLEMKYRVLDRHQAPFGLTFGVTPYWSPTDGTSGERADTYGADVLVMADKELIEGRLFGAVNLGYAPAASRPRATGAWERESAFFVSGALSGRVAANVFVGGEVRYERAYDGIALDHFAGEALFVGPTLYTRLGSDAWIGAAWNVQVAGRAAGGSGALDLDNFVRHEVVVRAGFSF